MPFLCLSRVQICTYLSLQSFGGNPNLGLWHRNNPEPTVLLGQTLQGHWHRTEKDKESGIIRQLLSQVLTTRYDIVMKQLLATENRHNMHS